VTNQPCEITNGTRVLFLNGDVDPEEGIVNGEPWVFFDGIDAVARIPVYATASGKTIDVHGHNIFRVAAEPLHSVKV
jgi:hypothetical protein